MPSPSPEKTRLQHLLTTTGEALKALKTGVVRRTATEPCTLNDHRQSSRRRTSDHRRHQNGVPTTNSSTFNHQPSAGRGSTQTPPAHTYLRNPTPTTEETAAQRQEARGQESPRTGTTPSPRRLRGGTSTDPSPAPPAPTRGSRIRDEQKAKHADTAPTETPPPATHLPTLYTAQRPRSGVPPPLPRRGGRRRREEPPAAPGRRGELDGRPLTRLTLYCRGGGRGTREFKTCYSFLCLCCQVITLIATCLMINLIDSGRTHYTAS